MKDPATFLMSDPKFEGRLDRPCSDGCHGVASVACSPGLATEEIHSVLTTDSLSLSNAMSYA